MNLQEFLKETHNKTSFKLIDQVADSLEHLKFILDFTFMPGELMYTLKFSYWRILLNLRLSLSISYLADDIRMNSNLFHWPEYIKGVFDIANTRLAYLQEAAEEALRSRIAALNKRISGSVEFVKIIQKMEVLSREEIQRAIGKLDDFRSLIKEFNDEAEAIAM